MTRREKILATVKKNQASASALPDLKIPVTTPSSLSDKFKTILTGIGGLVIEVKNWEEVTAYIKDNFKEAKRIVNTIPEVTAGSALDSIQRDPHLLENVNLAILEGGFGVAENGAIWVTDNRMGDRALPYICEHLALIIRREDIVHTLHDAYEKIGLLSYNLGTFIAGPSKTADIEQSLVLGAHGAKSLTVFLLQNL